jgi:diguanylate cyclase (GGDEF)-like protein
MALNSALHHEGSGYLKMLQKMRRGKNSAGLHRRLITIHQLASDLSATRDLDDLRACLTGAYARWLPGVIVRLFPNEEDRSTRNEGAPRDIALTWTRSAGSPIYIEDTVLSSDVDLGAPNPPPTYRSIMALPLRASGRVLGCLVLISPRPKRFMTLDYNLSLLVAAHVASALENVLTRQQLIETNSRLLDQEQELTALNRQLQELAHKDDLTGLYNKRRLLTQLDGEIARVRRYGGELSCLMTDLDGFKPINDSYGHIAGDEVLGQLGALFRSSCRDTDFIARYGGDEFTVLLPQTGAHGAACAAEKLRRKVNEHLFTLASGQLVSLTISIGIVTMPEDGQMDASEIIACADDALYCSKHSGGNAVFAADRRGAGSRICQPYESTLTHYACIA